MMKLSTMIQHLTEQTLFMMVTFLAASQMLLDGGMMNLKQRENPYSRLHSNSTMKHETWCLKFLIFSQINGRYGSAIDQLRFRFENYWAPAHGGRGGVEKICHWGEKITRVRGVESTIYGGFLVSIEFIGQSGRSCRIGRFSHWTFDVSHSGFYLSHLSGSLGKWPGPGGIDVIKSVQLHWKKM